MSRHPGAIGTSITGTAASSDGAAHDGRPARVEPLRPCQGDHVRFLGSGYLEDMFGRCAAAQFHPGAGLRAVAGEELLRPGMPSVCWLVPELGDGLGVKNVQHYQFGAAAGELLRYGRDGGR